MNLLEQEGPTLREWFGKSVVTDSRGLPLVVYHGTNSAFTVFQPHSHFGSIAAAHDRLSFKKNINQISAGGNIHPVYIRIEHPLYLDDSEANDEAVLRRSILNGKHPALMPWAKDYRITLSDLGYDGIVYTNNIEDAGKHSYIPFSPDQIRSVFEK